MEQPKTGSDDEEGHHQLLVVNKSNGRLEFYNNGSLIEKPQNILSVGVYTS